MSSRELELSSRLPFTRLISCTRGHGDRWTVGRRRKATQQMVFPHRVCPARGTSYLPATHEALDILNLPKLQDRHWNVLQKFSGNYNRIICSTVTCCRTLCLLFAMPSHAATILYLFVLEQKGTGRASSHCCKHTKKTSES